MSIWSANDFVFTKNEIENICDNSVLIKFDRYIQEFIFKEFENNLLRPDGNLDYNIEKRFEDLKVQIRQF